MNEPLVLENWELVYLSDAVARSIDHFSRLLEIPGGSWTVNMDSIESVIDHYKRLQLKLEAASVDKE